MKNAILLVMALVLLASVAQADVIKQTDERNIVVQGEAADEILNPDAETDRRGGKVLDTPEETPVIHKVVDDEKAAGGKALASPSGFNTPDVPLESIAVYRIQVTTAGTYYVYIRARNNGTPKNVSSDSLYGPATLDEESPSVTLYVQNSGEYKWQKFSKNYLLLPGDIKKPIEFRIGAREPDTHVDAIVFSRDNELEKTPEKLDALIGLK